MGLTVLQTTVDQTIFGDYGEPLIFIVLKATCLSNFSKTTHLTWTHTSIFFMHMRKCLSTWALLRILKLMNDFMPLHREKDEHYSLQFLWDSPNNGILFINKVGWNAQDDPIRLFSNFIGQQGLGDVYLESYCKHINLATFMLLFVRL